MMSRVKFVKNNQNVPASPISVSHSIWHYGKEDIKAEAAINISCEDKWFSLSKAEALELITVLGRAVDTFDAAVLADREQYIKDQERMKIKKAATAKMKATK